MKITTYKKTIDLNIIKQIETVENNIYLDKLRKEIEDLEKTDYTLLQYPKGASLELEQAIDTHNEPTIAMQMQNEEVLKEKKELLNKCQEVKYYDNHL